MEELTQEKIQKSISAAFDSVDLINLIASGAESIFDNIEMEKDCMKRNVDHLNIMMAKSWFLNALTDEQNNDINASIATGNNYLAV